MPTSSDDTVPHTGKPPVARTATEVDTAEVARGDTVMREQTLAAAESGDAVPAAAVLVELPPVPTSLRPHHRIRIGDGEPIELDRSVHIGRRPRAVRVPLPATPHLIEVLSPHGGISSTHLELREQGVAVVATDMRTLNGSEVRVPGSPVHTLLSGESVVVTPGTRIDLGEGIVVEILAPSRGEGLR